MKLDHVRQLAADLYRDRLEADDRMMDRGSPRAYADDHARAAIAEAEAFAARWRDRMKEVANDGT